nr:unnamed protein product [Callosobruchus chinensis]
MLQEECAAALVVTNEYKRRIRRKIWVKEWLKKRSTLSYIEQIKELRSSNGNNNLKNNLRMDEEGFQFLLNLIKPHIIKKGTFLFAKESVANKALSICSTYSLKPYCFQATTNLDMFKLSPKSLREDPENSGVL